MNLHEAAALLIDLTPTESRLFNAMASTLMLRHGDIGVGIREALEHIAAERAQGGAQ